MESNEVLDRLPRHLMSLVIDQPYNEYTPQDHAVWRYVMRKNIEFLPGVAHGSYTDGLRKTGISIEEIPHMYGMNRILKEIGWAAVAVDGFIPPSAFMEFQAYNVLVIAADIRPIDQIGYTPAPDIIHEAAGHAPIIANEEYAEYLRLFGEIGSKAFSSARDHHMYEAIRYLSILKADPYASKEEIRKAEDALHKLESKKEEPSEMALIRNLHWWTVEYGLIGDLKRPKIYGAGLLSSISESKNCLSDKVRKIPYSIEAAELGFDITNQQPQLFVTPDFQHLKNVLLEFSETMALKQGGIEGAKKAVQSGNHATITLSSGIQISGVFTEMIQSNGHPAFLKTTGPTAIAYQNKQLSGHGKHIHSHGFSTPIGMLRGYEKPLEFFSHSELISAGIFEGGCCDLEFESGISLRGILQQILRKNGKIIMLTFRECTVTHKKEFLFLPEWGNFDMAVGCEVVSAYAGIADPDNFRLRFPVPGKKTRKIIHTDQAKRLHSFYQDVRRIRQNNKVHDQLAAIWETLKIEFPDDWLLPLEILELTSELEEYSGINLEIKQHLSLKSPVLEDK